MVQLTLADISKHLTETVIDKAFKLRTRSEDKIRSVEVSRAAPAGEGLISAVYRLHVTGDKHAASFIAKGFANDRILRNSLNCTKYFKRETLFFSKFLPVLVEFQSSTGAKENIQDNIPVCYECYHDGENDYILLEDLAEKDCTTISETPTQCELEFTLKALAHLHATSMALRFKKPDTFARLASLVPDVYYTTENRDWYVRFLQKAVDIDRQVLLHYEHPSSIYIKKFEYLVGGDLYGKVIGILHNSGKFPVLSHGDAWCPNFLCLADRAVMIDFQLFRCASPATDLSLFTILCSNLCRTKEEFFKTVEIYYSSLEYYLADMGLEASKVFTRKDLQEELEKYGKFGLIGSITSIPLLASTRCDVLESFETKYKGKERIPLEDLWVLVPITDEHHKMRLVNAVRVAVDCALI